MKQAQSDFVNLVRGIRRIAAALAIVATLGASAVAVTASPASARMTCRNGDC